MKIISLLLLICLFSSSCNETIPFDEAAETAKILEIHHQQRDNHFNKDSIAFLSHLSDNFISVNRGVISQPTREATLSRFHNYFSSVDFIKWDDVSEPIIRFSEDGSLAYSIVDKIVEVSYPDEEGESYQSATHFAWTAIYKNYDGVWKIDCVTSTERPTSD